MNPEEEMIRREDKAAVRRLLTRLPFHWARALRLVHGIDGKEMIKARAAKAMRVTAGRFSTLYRDAILRCRRYLVSVEIGRLRKHGQRYWQDPSKPRDQGLFKDDQ